MQRENRLPEAEYDVMQAVWSLPAPATTRQIAEQMQEKRRLTLSALATLLTRLEKRGFVRSEKEGKERRYHPLVERAEYCRFETQLFLEKLHGNSLTSLMCAMSGNKTLTEAELSELSDWVEAQRRRHD